MTIPIRPSGPGPVTSPIERGLGTPLAPEQSESPFGDLLSRALGDVVRVQEQKADIIASFLRGDPIELHQVMAAAEEASLSLELLVETRNKFTEAYRTVMNIQA